VPGRHFFPAAGAASATGQTPTTLAVDKLATNQAIDRTVFTLPAGLGVTDVRRRAERIASGSGNHFIDIAPDPDDAGARHINIAHGLYPREEMTDAVLDRLADHLRAAVTLAQGRTYAGGLVKFEPREMERIPVPGPDMLTEGA